MTEYQFLLLMSLFIMIIFCLLLAKKDDKVLDLEKRVSFLEEKIKKTIDSRKMFIELKSVNAALDTQNNLFYDIDPSGNYIVDSEYTVNNVTDEWWANLSKSDLEIVNRNIHKKEL